MTTFLFTYNPEIQPWREKNKVQEISKEIAERGYSEDSRKKEGGHSDNNYRWNTISIKELHYGSRFFIMRIGKEPKGIIGSGHTLSATPYQDKHWRDDQDPDKKAWYVDCKYDALDPKTEPIIYLEYLKDTVPFKRFFNQTFRASGVKLPPEIADALEIEWDKKVPKSNIRIDPDYQNVVVNPEEDPRQLFQEAGKRPKTINRPERNPKARLKCIGHYGAKCVICGFSFGETFPGIPNAERHIDVHHHLVPGSEREEDHLIDIDPIKDLRPVCPNCHRALHLGNPLYTPEELAGLRKK